MKKSLFLVAFLVSTLAALAQQPGERARMESERKALQRELKAMQDEYNKVKGQKKVTLGQLNALLGKIAVQDAYIRNINNEIKVLSDEVYLSTLEINRLQRQLDTLKAQYIRSVVYAYKNRSSYDYLNFIFSANSFNDALKRVGYLRNYRAYRQQQVATIKDTQKAIEERKQQLLGKKTEKNSALSNQREQLAVLADQKKEKDVVVNKLKSQESDLSKQIASKKKRDKQLQNQIAAVIRREIDAARKAEAARVAAERKRTEEANRANPTTSTGSVATAPKKAAASKEFKPLNSSEKEISLSANFEKNKGSLPWPVDNGVVSIPYGTSKVGGLEFDNPGITISTPSAGTAVKAIFDGEVRSVSNTGDGMMVMIRHGKYFSVYSNLASANVSIGTIVRTGQSIGTTATADDGSGGQVDLIIMQEYTKVNPRSWLRR
ncbi:MAG: peptidoglycan DD-metalloendopeptidase family protein [Flaviaesturariibacter sp.]|nr:peptidoglycan DD-metalloendopeptidase family protein [Flaviaesturariibacter sp.]